MAKEYGRSQRVADFIKREVAQILQMEMRDPRLGMVNVTSVDVTRDLGYAKIFVTFFENSGFEAEGLQIGSSEAGGSDANSYSAIDIQDSVDVLNKAAGFLRSQLAKESTMRTIPKIRFYYDSSVIRGQKLSSLIDKAVKSDKARHQDDNLDDNAEDSQ